MSSGGRLGVSSGGRVAPERFAVFAVDPGGSSGVASGFFRNQGSVRKTLRRAASKGAFEAFETRGDSVEQAVLIAEAWVRFLDRAREYGIGPADIHFIIERFQLRQRHVELSPVEVTTAIKTLTAPLGLDYETQEPSQAMTFATNDRLRDWRIWVVGSEHARDAARHVALRVSRVLEGLVEG